MKFGLRSQNRQPEKRCAACGTAVTDADRFCPKCGAQISETVPGKSLTQEDTRSAERVRGNSIKRTISMITTVVLAVMQIVFLSFTICAVIFRYAAPISLPLPESLSEGIILAVVQSFYSMILGGILSIVAVLITLVINLSHISRCILSVGISLIFSGLLNLLLIFFATQQKLVYIIAIGFIFAGALLIFIYSCMALKTGALMDRSATGTMPLQDVI